MYKFSRKKMKITTHSVPTPKSNQNSWDITQHIQFPEQTALLSTKNGLEINS